MPVGQVARKALPYIGAALGGAGLGAAGGAYLGAKRGRKKGRREGLAVGVGTAARHFRTQATARNRALRVFAVRHQHLMRQNQALRARIGEMASRQKRT